jgi:hypothetical protein
MSGIEVASAKQRGPVRVSGVSITEDILPIGQRSMHVCVYRTTRDYRTAIDGTIYIYGVYVAMKLYIG